MIWRNGKIEIGAVVNVNGQVPYHPHNHGLLCRNQAGGIPLLSGRPGAETVVAVIWRGKGTQAPYLC